LLVIGSVALAFVAGGAGGALVTSAAASRSAQVGLEAARNLFVYDQAQRLAVAWNAGEMESALVHARCAFEAEHGEGAGWFDTKALGWGVWGGALLQKLVVEPNAASMARTRPLDEGIAHAKIAVVLERLGRADEARNWLLRASSVGGREPGWWREAGLKTVGVTLPEGFLRPDGVVRR
jgi:hypothetical protein